MGEKKKAAKEKPLEKMTAKELREVAMETSEITGVHGMNKEELVRAIKEVRGIAVNETAKQTDSSVRDIKKKIKGLKAKRENAVKSEDSRMADIYRRRIIRLKKKTRKDA
jgi:protein-arginine kinase activator protein McsA